MTILQNTNTVREHDNEAALAVDLKVRLDHIEQLVARIRANLKDGKPTHTYFDFASIHEVAGAACDTFNASKADK